MAERDISDGASDSGGKLAGKPIQVCHSNKQVAFGSSGRCGVGSYVSIGSLSLLFQPAKRSANFSLSVCVNVSAVCWLGQWLASAAQLTAAAAAAFQDPNEQPKEREKGGNWTR